MKPDACPRSAPNLDRCGIHFFIFSNGPSLLFSHAPLEYIIRRQENGLRPTVYDDGFNLLFAPFYGSKQSGIENPLSMFRWDQHFSFHYYSFDLYPRFLFVCWVELLYSLMSRPGYNWIKFLIAHRRNLKSEIAVLLVGRLPSRIRLVEVFVSKLRVG